jgi:hypothetical protein
MKIVAIKVSPLSMRMIQTECQKSIRNDVIFLNPTNTLYHIISCKPPYSKDFSTLTRTLYFSLPDAIAKVVAADQIGMQLHKIHKLQLCTDIQNMPPSVAVFESIRKVLKNYDIMEEDYNFEAAKKAYKDFKKNTAKSCRNDSIFVPQNGNVLEGQKSLYSIKNINAVINQFYNDNLPHFLTVSKTPCKRRTKQLYIYAYRVLLKVSSEHYEMICNIPARTQRHAIKQFTKFLSVTKNLTPFSPQS